MKSMYPEVLVFPYPPRVLQFRGYTKSEVEALQGRSFATKVSSSIHIGIVVGSYAYSKLPGIVEFGLLTEFKHNGDKDIWKGGLIRPEALEDGTTVFLTGRLAKEVSKEMKEQECMSRDVVRGAREEVGQWRELRLEALRVHRENQL